MGLTRHPLWWYTMYCLLPLLVCSPPSCHLLAVAALLAHGSAKLGVETLPDIWYMDLVLWVLRGQSCRGACKGLLEPWGELVTRWPWAGVQGRCRNHPEGLESPCTTK